MSSEPVLELSEVSCARGGRLVCPAQSLTVATGSMVWLRGRNGSGKTSLLRVLAGLGTPESGTVRRRDGLSTLYLAHNNSLKEDLSVLENLRFLAQLCGHASDPARLEVALKRWGLWSRRQMPARQLSQGLRRRVALARLSLARAQALWLLDEPFDALDDEGVATLREQLENHGTQGGACILSSHTAPGLSGQAEHWLEGQGAS